MDEKFVVGWDELGGFPSDLNQSCMELKLGLGFHNLPGLLLLPGAIGVGVKSSTHLPLFVLSEKIVIDNKY